MQTILIESVDSKKGI